MLPPRQRDRARWRSYCTESEDKTCGEEFHLTLAGAEARDRSHTHDLEIERAEDDGDS